MAMDSVDTDDRPDLEAVLMGAVEQARAAIIEFSGEDTLGEYLGAGFEDPTSATHRFLADMPGYKTTRPLAKSYWFPVRRRCWRPSGCRGTSASSPAT
jgi:hypothetical protein